METKSELIAFLFTDIEGSTKLWESQPDAMRSALEWHDALLHRTIAAHAGHVFKTVGDGFCAVFASPSNAITAAVSLQLALLDPASRLPLPLNIRIAVHTGKAEERSGDYVGQALNRVARLLAAGYGGQILISQVTMEFLETTMPSQIATRYLGTFHLKDLAQPEKVFQLVHNSLPAAFPPLRARRLKTKATPVVSQSVEV